MDPTGGPLRLLRGGPDGGSSPMLADFVAIRSVSSDPVMAKHGAEIPKRRGTVLVGPLPLARWGDHGAKVREEDMMYLEGRDRRVREGADLPVFC